ncbi:MAG: radical SAM protein, partial [Myxococcota bacterium]|nr:radical SAM protein [Myxococcota bacterium]
MSDEGERGGGIYVHYPFCVHRCPFCDFTLITPRNIPHQSYTDALISELTGRAASLKGPAQTLYIGGGTPSLWSLGELGRFLDAVRREPGLVAEAEITIEANPTEVSAPWLSEILARGINRVSLGIQSLRDDLLRSLERTHDAAQALWALDLLLSSDLGSVSMDMMFGIEGQTAEAWSVDRGQVRSLGVPHLSVYGLTGAEGTPLGDRVR